MNTQSDNEEDGFKRLIIWFVILLVFFSIGFALLNRTVRTVDTGITRYEEYTEIYQTCERINTDLCNLKDVPDTDRQFQQFSKAQQTLILKKQLNRWVEDYNAKSKMINRSLWKSSQLPYQLSVSQFTCY